MSPRTSSVVTAAQPAFLVEIGNVADLRQRQAPLFRLGRRPANLQLAEIAREIAQPFVVEMLVMEVSRVRQIPDERVEETVLRIVHAESEIDS